MLFSAATRVHSYSTTLCEGKNYFQSVRGGPSQCGTHTRLSVHLRITPCRLRCCTLPGTQHGHSIGSIEVSGAHGVDEEPLCATPNAKTCWR